MQSNLERLRRAQIPMHARLSTNTSRFTSALVLIALVLIGRFAESIHSAEVGHVICPEHGELMHVADVHSHVQSADVPLGQCLLPIEGSAEHEHCLLATLLWSSGTTWTPTAFEFATLPPIDVCRAARVDGDRFALPPLAFAPKHSPPTAIL